MCSLGRGMRRLLILFGMLFVLALLPWLHPRARAAVRWSPGFQALEEDSRVFYEPGAEAHARRVAKALPAAMARVEECQGRPLEPGFRVYMCVSHGSFTRRLGESPDSPARGMKLCRDIWVSPLAFDFRGSDTHRQTIAHELSHLHMTQQLGLRSIMGPVPTWFVEGLANWVAHSGGEIVSRRDALEAFARGDHFVPDATGRFLFPRTAKHYGVSWPMLHQQSRLFVEYLHERSGRSFEDFIVAVGRGERFEAAFQAHCGDSLGNAWSNFLESLGRSTEPK